MPTTPAIEKLSEVQDRVLELIDQIQEPIVNAVRESASRAESRLPELPAVPFGDQLPGADEVVANQFGFINRLVEQQKAFAESVVEAARPVSDKLVVVEDEAAEKAAKPKSKASKAA